MLFFFLLGDKKNIFFVFVFHMSKRKCEKTFWQLEKKSISLKYMIFQEKVDGNFKEK